ncbi:prolyl oligopeptidase family serine peptidase [Frateuria sp. GZRe12]|uniref:S9 family peptidase n=1 Tax=Frateuria sp. GZRe12 TaxID=3351533 RepID=UPI003EDBE6FB
MSAVLLSCASGALAAPPDVESFAKLPMLRSPSLSPDGQYLALSLHNNNARWDEADYQLVVFHLPDLKGVSRLDMAPHYQPAQIVWVSNTRLAVSLAYTSGSLEVPQQTGEVIAVDYDGSHKQTLYSARERGAAGSGIHSMDMPRGLASIAGLPYPRNGHIYLHLSRWPERQITNDWDAVRSEVYDVDASNGKASLVGSIDKGNMAFVLHDGVARYAYGLVDAHTMDVYAREAASQPWRKLDASVTGREMTPLRMSRDGSKLWSLYSADGGPEALVVTRPDGSDRQVLASDAFAAVDEVLWDEATDTPYAAVFADGRPHLAYLDQSVHAQVLKALNDKFADHLVTIGSMDQSGKSMLVVATSDRDPGSVALFDTRTMNLRPLYQVEDWVHPEQMAERRPFRFKASDGMELAGYITLPQGRAPKKLPTILLPHGGPIGPSDGWNYDPDSQFLASLGYAVVQINYRGSGGRGPDFQQAGYRHFGDRIQQDLLDGLNWAIGQGYVDQARLCVYGGSFGGYSSLMQPILSPGLFKCAIDYAGVSDWSIGFRKSDTSHLKLGRKYFAEAIGDETAARAISPLYQLDRFNVPVLIAHGEDDPRVPYENAKVLRSALEKAGKSYEWLSKPKEGHGFYTEEDRADMYRHMQAFLAKYLGD